MKSKLFCTVIAVVFISCGPGVRNQARISFTGDIIMHIPVKSAARERNVIDPDSRNTVNNGGFDFLFQRVREVFAASDQVVGNMEFPVSPPFTSTPMIFNCNPAVLGALKNAGFTVMNVANNHIMDQGAGGLRNTLGYIKENGLEYVGAGLTREEAGRGLVKEIAGIRVGIIGYTEVLNYPPPGPRNGPFINLLGNKKKVEDDITAMKTRCDYLVMIVHAGNEYDLEPSAGTRRLLAGYIDMGVDLVVGHHPHVLQPVEKIRAADGRNGFIFYSLGNFISNQSSTFPLEGDTRLGTRDSVVLSVVVSKDGGLLNTRFEAEPIITVNGRDESMKRVIQTVPITAEMRKINDGGGPDSPAHAGELESRLRAIRNSLFRYGELEEVTVIER